MNANDDLARRCHGMEAKIRELNQHLEDAGIREQRLRYALDGSELAVWDWNIETSDIIINARWATMLGYELDEINLTVGTWENLIHPDDRESVYAALNAHLAGETEHYHQPHRVLTKSGAYKWILDHGKIFEYDDAGNPRRAVGTHRDIDNEKNLERELEQLGLTDPLTGLPNRRQLQTIFEHDVSVARRQGNRITLLFIDLDGFKPVNDELGHDAGDSVLCEVAKRLRRSVREGELVARLGGDEFCVLLTSAQSRDQIVLVGRRILSNIAKPIEVGSIVNIGCSIGVATYPDNGESFEAVLSRADEAMYQVKTSGRNSIAFFN